MASHALPGTSCLAETSTGHEIHIDVPRAIGGTDTAAEPVYHLLAALAACEAATARYVALKMRPRVVIAGMRFTLNAERNQNGALQLPIDTPPEVWAGLTQIVGTCTVHTEAPQEQVDRLAEQVHVRCPVASMVIASGCVLNLEYIATPPTPTVVEQQDT
jgi:uncharacterized OsmC-like protein